MKPKLIVITLLLTLNCVVRAQTADDYVEWGRAALAGTNMVAANSAFAHALAADPNNQTANVLFATTRILVLPYQAAGSNFLNRLGFSTAGRDIYNWTADVPKDRSQNPVVPAGLNADELTALVRTNFIGEIIGAEANLAKVTDSNFTLTLSAGETRTVSVTLDYGDIQMLRAMLSAAEYGAYTACSYNWDVELPSLWSFITNEQFTVESLLINYPALMTFATTNDLILAKSAFQNGANQYMTASQFIRNRPAGVTRLFNLSPEQLADEQTFRTTLVNLTNSFAGAVPLTAFPDYTVFLGSFFSGKNEIRGFLPKIISNSFVLGSLPDLSFGGLIYGLPLEAVEGLLARNLQPIPGISMAFNQTPGNFGFPLHVLTGRGYIVQVSTNLTSWSNYAAFVADAGVHQFSDPFAGSSPQRFYRLVDWTDNMPVPANDNFANRVVLNGIGISTVGYNANSSNEANEPGYPGARTTWYSWTAPVTGTVIISIEGLKSFAYAEIYTGSALTNLTHIAYSGHSFEVVVGTTYQIQILDGGSAPGGFKITISMPPVLTVYNPTNGSIFKAGVDIPINASTVDGDGTITHMEVYADDHLLGSSSNSTLELIWSNVPAGYYYLEISATDNLGITTLSNLDIWVTPDNDNFADAIPITDSSITVTGANINASKETGEPIIGETEGGSSVWWSWIAPSNGTTVVNVWFYKEWRTYLPLLGIYTGNTVSNLTTITDATALDYNYPASVSFNATAGTTYKFAVDAAYGYQGNIYMKLIQPQSQKGVLINSPMTITNLSSAAGGMTYFYTTIPPGVNSSQISISGGTGDCDVYVRHGSAPTLTEWDYRPYVTGNNESTVIQKPASGEWFIMLYGYEAYSGVSLIIQ